MSEKKLSRIIIFSFPFIEETPVDFCCFLLFCYEGHLLASQISPVHHCSWERRTAELGLAIRMKRLHQGRVLDLQTFSKKTGALTVQMQYFQVDCYLISLSENKEHCWF